MNNWTGNGVENLDLWNNRLVEIPLNFSSDTITALELTFEINYTWNKTIIENQSQQSLVEIIQTYLDEASPTGKNEIVLPIVTNSTTGEIELYNLTVNYSAPGGISHLIVSVPQVMHPDHPVTIVTEHYNQTGISQVNLSLNTTGGPNPVIYFDGAFTSTSGLLQLDDSSIENYEWGMRIFWNFTPSWLWERDLKIDIEVEAMDLGATTYLFVGANLTAIEPNLQIVNLSLSWLDGVLINEGGWLSGVEEVRIQAQIQFLNSSAVLQSEVTELEINLDSQNLGSTVVGGSNYSSQLQLPALNYWEGINLSLQLVNFSYAHLSQLSSSLANFSIMMDNSSPLALALQPSDGYLNASQIVNVRSR